MQPELQHAVDLLARLLLDLLKRMQVPRVENEWLFTDGVGTNPECKSSVGVVQVVGRADAHVLDCRGVALATELFDVTIEAFDFGEEPSLRCVAVDDANGVVEVDSGDETIASVFDRPHVARGDKTGGADQCKVQGCALRHTELQW